MSDEERVKCYKYFITINTMRNKKFVSISKMIVLLLITINVIIVRTAFIGNSNWYWALVIFVPLLLLAIANIRQKKHAILRNYPLLGYLRYFFESIRPEMRQYFFESDLDGKPFSRRQRSIVYQRAKNVKQTVPFGMQSNSQEIGYEWIAHAMFPA